MCYQVNKKIWSSKKKKKKVKKKREKEVPKWIVKDLFGKSI